MLEAGMIGMPHAATAAAADDRRLATACASGDSAVFEEIYQRYGKRMKNIAWNYLGNISDAEDAVQETFLKIHRSAGSFTGEASFATWVIRILSNSCVDLLRKRKRRGEEATIEDEVAQLERRSPSVDPTKRIALRRLLDELPAQRRSVFTLFEIEGLSHAEIGAVLGISEGNSKWILFSTKKQLQEMWAPAPRSSE